MGKRKLLIADSTEEFCMAMEAALQDEFYVRTTTDGNAAQEILGTFAPDVMVLDVMLPGLDGIRVLQNAAEQGRLPKVLATTPFRSDYIIEKLTQLDVSYIMLKPCYTEIAAERVREISVPHVIPVRSVGNSGARIPEILLELGFCTKHDGYHYLCDAIERYMADNRQSLTKELYGAVGAAYGVGWQQVERSIRSAVEAAWKRRDERKWHQWFPAGTISALGRPTNGEVISQLAECLLLERERKFG